MPMRSAGCRHLTLADARRSRTRRRARRGRHAAARQPRARHHHDPGASAAAVVAELADWAELREAGQAIKDPRPGAPRTLPAPAGGAGHRRRAARCTGRATPPRRTGSSPDLVKATGETEVVKVKSMATQEIGLNEAPGRGGHHRLRDRPRRADRAARRRPALAHPRPGDPPQPRRDPRHLPARRWPRRPGRADRRPRRARRGRPRATCASKFLSRARSAVSGANFAVAETGTLVVVESEGNGRMCLTLPETLISVMGIEKVVPDLAGPGGVPAAAAALLHRRADEPVHLARGPAPPPATARATSTSSCWTTAAPPRWPTRWAGRRCAASAAPPA